MCVQCGAAKNLEVSLQDNHSRIYYYICSLGLQSEAPDIWMNPRLNEKCSSCQGSSMVPKAETRCKNDWVFLYLIEALGCLSLEELRRFCVENKEPHDMMEKKRVLFQVYHHLSNKMQEIRPMYTGMYVFVNYLGR
ncbi:hypothetical protein CFOL_v3_33805 [Cephalotus follicularis]|uniref:DUF7086 domain-containing protein n=1 Tax=Cephalotus follicularis TaxID=3775 RepID=A0A1Q3DCX8_CEPFO|nr:hypothetical protein CFOL_v3_33805 [Cephalotus follicularis]